LLEVVKELQEIIVGMLEIEDEAESEVETEAPELEITPTNPDPIGNPEEDNVNWPVAKSEHVEDYESDNEEEDKWDNIQKACWTGYKQVGMKDKNGKQVPNCVPIEKSNNEVEKKSPWGGAFKPEITR
jgi:hypothetical protein